MSRRTLVALVAPFVLGLGCGPEGPAGAPPQPSASAAVASAAKRPAFENPGGMWMPEQIPAQADRLRALGLEIDPAALSEPTSDTLAAVVSLGGCSASFVSADGLVATNHHCAVGALQLNSTPKENLLRDGFLARTRAEERSNGPSARVLVTRALRDVTAEITPGLADIKDDLARYKKVEERTKALVAACEKGRPEVRCNVAEFYGGAAFRLVEQLEIKDVRLVYSPHDGVGDFGGEIDNWHWPRHSGDVALFRAYVGKDGKPADHAADNVPYHPPHHFKLASKPLSQGDLVIVAGYPAATNRLRTSAEVVEAVSFGYPHKIQWCEEHIALLEQLRKAGPDVAIKVTPRIRSLSNAMTKWRGIMDGLVKGGLAAEKAKIEAEITASAANDEARKAELRGALDRTAQLVVDQQKTRRADFELYELNRLVTLYGAAAMIVRMAEERPKADADRDPGYQQRNWARLEQEQTTLQKRYDRSMERAILKLVLQRALRSPIAERSSLTGVLLGGATDAQSIDKATEALFAGTALEDEAARLKLLRTASMAELAKSRDTLVQLAVKLRSSHGASEDREHAIAGALLLHRPKFIDALRRHRAEKDPSAPPLAPDANGTLRLTYGTVRGYRPRPDAPEYRPFTTISEMVQKVSGTWPFISPPNVLDAIKAKRFGPYVDATLGEVPIDFLSDLDITGGNSGSATLNSRGEIVGLAFDGNYEAMASDWLYTPSITRTIHVDMRYVTWLLDATVPGDHLIREMGGKPSVD